LKLARTVKIEFTKTDDLESSRNHHLLRPYIRGNKLQQIVFRLKK